MENKPSNTKAIYAIEFNLVKRKKGSGKSLLNKFKQQYLDGK